MVQYQVLDFPFKGGQNDKIAEQVMPTGLLENAVNPTDRDWETEPSEYKEA